MDIIERKKWKKQIKICEKLGARKFQKVVFSVEKIKFKMIKKFFPSYLNRYDKYCDKERNRLIKKAKTDAEKRKIIRNTQYAKMLSRKEYYLEQNINYHIDEKDPTAMYHFLDLNKKIHRKGLIKNGVLLPIFIVMSFLGINWAIPFLITEIFSAGINFECINIQNYNIARLKIMEEKLIKRAQRNLADDINNYSEAAKVVSKCIKEKEKRISENIGLNNNCENDLPIIDDILSDAKTLTQVKELKEIALRGIEKRSKLKEERSARKK